ncbi:MAG: M23 family metallopeptidase [Anaerolineae bacterium]
MSLSPQVGRRSSAARFLLLAVVMALLAGCQTLFPAAATSPTLPVESTATTVATSTLTATPEPTATPIPTRTPMPTPTLAPLVTSVGLEPAILVQGRTLSLQINTNRPCAVEGTHGGNPLHFVTDDGLRHLALVGIDAVAELGPRFVHLAITGEDLQTTTLDTQIIVVAGEFETESLTFTSEVSKLLAPEITQPENERLAEVFGAFSPSLVLTDTLAWPVDGPFTSYFGTRREYDGRLSGYHAGVDIDGDDGDVVRAGGPGIVVLAEPLQVRGNTVILDHGAGVFSAYLHLQEIGVEVGQQVAQGDPIGEMGSTGLVTGSHLHWELRVGGVAVDPSEWVERSFVSTP